jgi:hypothetical protein
MSHRVFTWWRRFHTTRSLPKEQKWKGYSELLQRIEWGEFEYDQLSEQSKLEEKIFELECEEIRKELNRSNEDVIQDRIFQRRKLKNKRIEIMMERHLKKEMETLSNLAQSLGDEFSLTKEEVLEFMETFDGTTRHLYYAIRAHSQGKPIPTEDDIALWPRTQPQQPRHIMKHEHRILFPIWEQVVKQYKIWNAYGISE